MWPWVLPLSVCLFYCFVCLFSAGGHDVWVLSNQPGPRFTMGNLYLMLVLVQGCPHTTILPHHTPKQVQRASPNSRACAPSLPTIHALMPKAPHSQQLPAWDLLPLHAAKAHQRITLLLGGNRHLLQAAHHMGAGMRGMRSHKKRTAAFRNHTTTSHYNYNTAYNLPCRPTIHTTHS